MAGPTPPTPAARVEDLLIRFGALARELAPQLPAPAAAPLLQELSRLLQELPAVDATSHRYALLRDLRVRMQRAMAPLLDAAAAASEGPEHEEAVYQRCLQHADFLDLQVALGRELTAACAELDVAHADGIASAVTDGRAASEGSASTCADGMHDALVELGDLPPFLELPAILHELAACSASSAHGDAAPAGAWLGAWRRLQCFSASDLIHSEAWHDVPVALAALLRHASAAAAAAATAAAAAAATAAATDAVEPAGVSADEAAAAEREVIELHAQLFDEGAAPQKVAALTALAAHARRARGEARLLCCHHLSRCRCALPAEAPLLRAAEVQAVVGACVALATESAAADGNAADGDDGDGDSPPVAHLMAALDPAARWLALLLARGTWATAAWAAAAPRLLESCARACAVPLPVPPTSATPATAATVATAATACPPAAWELGVAEGAHHCVCLALLLRCLADADAAAAAAADADADADAVTAAATALAIDEQHERHDLAWARRMLPLLPRKALELAALRDARGATPFVRRAAGLALSALAAALAALAEGRPPVQTGPGLQGLEGLAAPGRSWPLAPLRPGSASVARGPRTAVCASSAATNHLSAWAGAARPDGAALWCGDAALALLRPVEALCAEGRAQLAQPALLAALLEPAAAPASPRGTAAVPRAAHSIPRR